MIALLASASCAIFLLIGYLGGRAYEEMLWVHGYRIIFKDGRAMKWDFTRKKWDEI